MKILFLEPFFGGSHKDFALGFQQTSRHEVTLVTLPDCFWKWRMRGAALHFADHIPDFSAYDAIMATDMMNLTDLRSFAGKKMPPVLFYFHENQMSYPLAPGVKKDTSLGLINIMSAAAADQVIFNSDFHLNEFMGAANGLIRQMPDFKPEWIMDTIGKKARTIYPGCRFSPGDPDLMQTDDTPPLIIWNHRWDYDKNPGFFFKALGRIKKKNIPFSLALLGERFDMVPEVFESAREEFRDEIKVYGYVESRKEYLSWLKKGGVVVSCANQENFGISVVEAVRFGSVPLLPDRLSYPEIMNKKFHDNILYRGLTDFETKLGDLLLNYPACIPLREALSKDMERFSWEIISEQFDTALENL